MTQPDTSDSGTWLIVVNYTWQDIYRVCMPLFYNCATEEEAIYYGRRFCQDQFNAPEVRKESLLVLRADEYRTVPVSAE